MSIADKYRPRFTYDDYLLWEGRWELIEGMPYAMSPITTPRHQRVGLKLSMILENALIKSCDPCLLYTPIDWKINEDTVVQPDLLIACKPIEKKHLDFTPALVLEILSPVTAFKDRHEKFELYQQKGVKYYLIVDHQFKKIEIYELIDAKYQPVNVTPTDLTFTLDEGCRVNVSFDTAWG